MKLYLQLPVLCFLLAAVPAAAQEMDQAEYRKMMEQMMKSGNSSSQTQSQAQSWDARLKVVSGNVMVKTVEKDEWSKIDGEMPLDPNDMVKTASDGVAEIYLDNKGAIAVGRNTELEISSLDQEDAVITLSFGSLAAKIKHMLNAKHNFQVRTPSVVCAVRGTEFAVEHLQLGKESKVAVFDEGRVAVTQAGEPSDNAPQEYLLEKNTEIIFTPGQKRIRTVPLSRMSRYRSAVMNMRKRVEAIRGWKPMTAARRAELRDRALKRRVIRKEIKRGKTKSRSSGVKKRAAAQKAKRQYDSQE
jgi:hypothetical protein